MSAAKPWAAGWPRGRVSYDDYRAVAPGDEPLVRSIPAIFLGGANQAQGDFLSFGDDELRECVTAGKCVVCGLGLHRVVVFGHTNRHETNGPPAHPRCFAMALKFCPRYTQPPYTRKPQTCAYVYRGDDYRAAVGELPPGTVTDMTEAEAQERENDRLMVMGGQYTLNPRLVRAARRADIIHIVKTDPLGTGGTP
jgi:hypothetical protein